MFPGDNIADGGDLPTPSHIMLESRERRQWQPFKGTVEAKRQSRVCGLRILPIRDPLIMDSPPGD